jgi:Ca-activated chloride channel family protein
MGIFEEGGVEPAAEEAEGPALLEKLADLTGGRHFAVSVDNLSTASSRISALLRNRYLVGYISSNAARDGKYRKVTLELNGPPDTALRVQYRKGYYAPRQ